MGSALMEIKINPEADKNLNGFCPGILNAEESDCFIFWEKTFEIQF